MEVTRHTNTPMVLGSIFREVDGQIFTSEQFPSAPQLINMVRALISGVPLPGVLLRATDIAGSRSVLRGKAQVRALDALLRGTSDLVFLDLDTGEVHMGVSRPTSISTRTLYRSSDLRRWLDSGPALPRHQLDRAYDAHRHINTAVIPVTTIICDDEAATLARELAWAPAE